jgi:hypothetical protein
MLQMTNPAECWYEFRIGFRPSGRPDAEAAVSPGIGVSCKFVILNCKTDRWSERTTISDDIDRLRFWISADITTGVVSGRVFRTADDRELPEPATAKHITSKPWFSFQVSPDFLRDSSLIVYFYGAGSEIRLINTFDSVVFR